DSALAFASVEYIMREVPGGWFIRYMHSTGASFFFIVIYLHMFRGLLYGSYRTPREIVWVFGMLIYLCLMAEAFFGYLLPWGQMSYWGAQVIVNLFSAIPFVGPDLSLWIRGDYVVGDATLNRFFSFHVIAIPLDGIPFHPYYTVHDLMAVSGFLILFCAVLFFAPEMGGYFLEANNFLPADQLKTPPHIAPVWYFTPYYSMLRATTDQFTWVLAAGVAVGFLVWLIRVRPAMRWAVPAAIVALVVVVLMRTLDAKVWGVALMGGAVVMLFFLPWLDRSPVKSIRYRPAWHSAFLAVFVAAFLVLGYLGTQEPGDVTKVMAQVGTVIYFAFFLAMPIWSQMGTF